MSLIEISKTLLARRLQSKEEAIVYAEDGVAELLQVTVGLDFFKGKPSCQAQYPQA